MLVFGFPPNPPQNMVPKKNYYRLCERGSRVCGELRAVLLDQLRGFLVADTLALRDLLDQRGIASSRVAVDRVETLDDRGDSTRGLELEKIERFRGIGNLVELVLRVADRLLVGTVHAGNGARCDLPVDGPVGLLGVLVALLLGVRRARRRLRFVCHSNLLSMRP